MLTFRGVERLQQAALWSRRTEREPEIESRQPTDERESSQPCDDFSREVNDQIMQLGERFGYDGQALELICECDDPTCTERVLVAHEEFAKLRGREGLHLVATGHRHPGRVVSERTGYVVFAD